LKRPRITDAELLAAIGAAEESAIGATRGGVTSDRADAIDRYLGKTYGDEKPGESQVISRDVADVVEGVTANVLKPFVGGDQVVQFDPRGPEDEAAAQQETDYVNFVVLERNNGFLTLNTAVKDALLLRNGYAMGEWHVRQDVISETYEGLTDEQVAMLDGDDDVETVAHSEYPDQQAAAQIEQQMQQAMAMGQPPQQMPEIPMLHDVTVRRSRPTEYVKVEPVPPDEILVSQHLRNPSLQDADFVQRRQMVTISALREAGYDVSDDISDDDSGETTEDYSRDRDGESYDKDDPTSDPARRLVLLKKSWLRIDRDGDGIAELRHVCQVGETLLLDEECAIVPVACFAGIVFPHKHLGVSVYDLVKDVAQIKTALMRQYLNNKYLANNARVAVNSNNVNLDDLLTSRTNGVIRVDGDPGINLMPIITPDTGTSALQGLEYLDTVRENRTGYTRNTAGLESDALTNTTATGMAMQMTQSQLRLEMIARTIAETGVRDLFRIVHALTLQHSTREEKVRLRNKWVDVNPREWARRTDLSITVGLGNASQQQMVGNLMLLGQAQQMAMPLGLVTPKEIFNTLRKLPTAMGFKNAEEFFAAPKINPQTGQAETPPPPKPEAVQVEEIKQQGKQAELQATVQADVQKTQATLQAELQAKQSEQQMNLAVQAANDQREAELEALRLQHAAVLADKELQHKQVIAEFDAGKEGELQRQKFAHEKEMELIKQHFAAQQAELQAQQQAKDNDQTPHFDKIHKRLDDFDAPKEIVRGPDGRVAGVKSGSKVRKVARDGDGRMTGLN